MKFIAYLGRKWGEYLSWRRNRAIDRKLKEYGTKYALEDDVIIHEVKENNEKYVQEKKTFNELRTLSKNTNKLERSLDELVDIITTDRNAKVKYKFIQEGGRYTMTIENAIGNTFAMQPFFLFGTQVVPRIDPMGGGIKMDLTEIVNGVITSAQNSASIQFCTLKVAEDSTEGEEWSQMITEFITYPIRFDNGSLLITPEAFSFSHNNYTLNIYNHDNISPFSGIYISDPTKIINITI